MLTYPSAENQVLMEANGMIVGLGLVSVTAGSQNLRMPEMEGTL